MLITIVLHVLLYNAKMILKIQSGNSDNKFMNLKGEFKNLAEITKDFYVDILSQRGRPPELKIVDEGDKVLSADGYTLVWSSKDNFGTRWTFLPIGEAGFMSTQDGKCIFRDGMQVRLGECPKDMGMADNDIFHFTPHMFSTDDDLRRAMEILKTHEKHEKDISKYYNGEKKDSPSGEPSEMGQDSPSGKLPSMDVKSAELKATDAKFAESKAPDAGGAANKAPPGADTRPKDAAGDRAPPRAQSKGPLSPERSDAPDIDPVLQKIKTVLVDLNNVINPKNDALGPKALQKDASAKSGPKFGPTSPAKSQDEFPGAAEPKSPSAPDAKTDETTHVAHDKNIEDMAKIMKSFDEKINKFLTSENK